MPRPQDKVDMVQMNAAIGKVLALPAAPKAKQKARVQRKTGYPPPAKSSKSTAQSAAR